MTITPQDMIEWLDIAAKPCDNYLPNYFDMIKAIRDFIQSHQAATIDQLQQRLKAAEGLAEALKFTKDQLDRFQNDDPASVVFDDECAAAIYGSNKALSAWEATK